MRYKHFKNADVDVSSLAIGTWAIGGARYGEVNEKDSVDAIHYMIDNGVNLIDTAPAYNCGISEEIVGRALKGGYREKVFISTKFGIGDGMDKAGVIPRDASREACFKECEDSLRRLDVDYIDFYFVHWPDANTPIAETMDAMLELKKQGKIRYIGVSNFDKPLIEECLKTTMIDAFQPPYSMVNESEKELMKWCNDKGIASFSYGSLGSGILTGAIRSIPNWDPLDFRFTFYDFYKEPKFSKCMELLKTLDKISANNGHPLSQIALNWSTQKDYVGTALCGVRNVKEATENCNAFDWTLTEEEIKIIDDKLKELNI
ncbi:MAG: aldo/keto reductase [Ruminococcaceae bacterium]|nr:aldo/keto reductase [Oscillospiraceae bacterium]